jgi:hypothetical protein
MGDERRVLSALALTVVVAGGCLGESTLDLGTPVNLHVWTSETTVEVDAPGWLTAASSIYLCFAAPPRLPSDAVQRQEWDPGETCQDFGTIDSQEGLRASIPISMLDPDRRSAFEAAPDWYVLLVARDGGRATSAMTSRFHAPRLP